MQQNDTRKSLDKKHISVIPNIVESPNTSSLLSWNSLSRATPSQSPRKSYIQIWSIKMSGGNDDTKFTVECLQGKRSFWKRRKKRKRRKRRRRVEVGKMRTRHQVEMKSRKVCWEYGKRMRRKISTFAYDSEDGRDRTNLRYRLFTGNGEYYPREGERGRVLHYWEWPGSTEARHVSKERRVWAPWGECAVDWSGSEYWCPPTYPAINANLCK